MQSPRSKNSRALAKERADRTHDKYVQRQYGLEPGEYLRLLSEQDGRCAICTRIPRRRRLAVDHSHLSGKVRALLCLSCNHDTLGRLEADPIALLNLIEYVKNILREDFPEYIND